MTIKEILSSKNVSVSFEVFPPKQQTAFDSVVSTAQRLAELKPDFMSITYGAAGSTRSNTVEIASAIEKLGIPALAHLTCVSSSPDDVDSVIKSLQAKKISNVLALRGDIPADTEYGSILKEFEHASDLVPVLKKAGFCVGGACYPEGHPESANRDDDIAHLKYKVEAGCDFLTTQMIFDNDMLYSFLYRMESQGIHIPVLAGIMPITSPAQIKRMIKLSNAYIPRKLLMIVDRFSENPEALKQAGIAYAVDQIIDLISNGIHGIHIYSMNKSDVTASILSNINEIVTAVNSKSSNNKSSN